MTFNISEFMDGLSDETLALADAGITTPDRILALVRERSGTTGRAQRKKPRKLGRILLIAATLTALLSVTAYGVYQALLKDHFVTSQTLLDGVIEDLGGESSPRTTISLVGYQNTTEYEAYIQWEAWLAEHRAEYPMDNSSWHETPDNYYYFYDAAYQAQADKLDEITEKYGVHLHENRAFASADEIYALLGSEPFLSDGYDKSSGYIYNDGTFNLEFIKYHGDVDDLNALFVSIKGTITNISGVIDTSDEYEEWSYQTASGPVVDLVITSRNAHIFYETESAYVHVGSTRLDQTQTGVYVPHTRQSLEALADSVNFAELAEVFDESAAFDLSQAVAELDARYKQEMLEINERAQREAKEDYRTSLEVVEELGAYVLSPIQEGWQVSPFAWADLEETVAIRGGRWDYGETVWGTTVGSVDEAISSYSPPEGWIELCYYRYYTDSSRTVSATAAQFEAAKAHYAAFEGFAQCTVNGCPGFYFPETRDAAYGTIYAPGVMWLDEAHDLVFRLEMYDASYFDPQTGEIIHTDYPFIPEELMALAEAVTEAE